MATQNVTPMNTNQYYCVHPHERHIYLDLPMVYIATHACRLWRAPQVSASISIRGEARLRIFPFSNDRYTCMRVWWKEKFIAYVVKYADVKYNYVVPVQLYQLRNTSKCIRVL